MPNATVRANARTLPDLQPRRGFLTAPVAAGVAASAPATSSATASSTAHPDRILLALGEVFKTEWAKEIAAVAALDKDTDVTTENEPCGTLCRQIISHRATALDGLRVKAMAISWCYDGELTWGTMTTDMALAGSIVEDLLALGPAQPS
jgi:hypothetical protein